MAESIASELLKSLLEKLVCAAVDEARFAAERDSHLKELANTKAMVDAFLLDQDNAAMTLQNGTRLARHELLRLRSAFDMIDDLLDETAARSQIKRGAAGFKDRVRLFFTADFNPILCLWRDVKHVKGIRGELDSITKDHTLLGSILSMLPSNVTETSAPNRETGSDVILKEVIGRDQERDDIIGMLLDSRDQKEPFSVIAIVGFGGLGKTTLARVYNDERVKKHFDTLLWVYASRDFVAKEILLKILASGRREERAQGLVMDEVQRRVKEMVDGKRYLLVLDDTWDSKKELCEEWQKLRTTLVHGAKGSKVLITTREQSVAKIVGCVEPYTLWDLKKEEAWNLFKYFALMPGCQSELEMIGKEIVEMVPSVPLVIRTIAGTLSKKPKTADWLKFKNEELPVFTRQENVIQQCLKLSYDQFDPWLKLCFTSCSLYPKGYRFDKHELVCLWIALGHVKARLGNQSLEDRGEEYVLSLLQCGFFEVALEDWFGCIERFKMHDLIHDLAISLSGNNYKMVDSLDSLELAGGVSHVCFSGKVELKGGLPPSLLKTKEKLRSLLLPRSNMELQLKELHKLQYLRALSLPRRWLKEVPSSIGKLIHLRYLNLSENLFSSLPKSITQLVNLFCLELTQCEFLEELPRDMSKLVKLKHLHLYGCVKLTHMPLGLGKLTHLEILDNYVVGENQSSGKGLVGGLDELTHLNNLKGELAIVVKGFLKGKLGSNKKAIMEENEKLNSLTISFEQGQISKEQSEMVLDSFKPHVNLKHLFIESYKGEKLPSWMMELGYLHKLTEIFLLGFEGCRYLCALGRLPHLKVLNLSKMSTLEYIEQSTVDTASQLPAAHPLFPSLKALVLYVMPCLKGWCSITCTSTSSSKNQHVEDSRRQRLLKYRSAFPMLKRLTFSKVGFEVIPEEFQGASSLESLEITQCEKLKGISEWIGNFTCLRKLEVDSCPELTWLPKQMGRLSNLEELEIINCPCLRETYPEERGQDEQFTSSLPKLKTSKFESVGWETVPDWFQGVSCLESLVITHCQKLKGISEWIGNFTCLQKLEVGSCPELTWLPKQMGRLSNLEELEIINCPCLRETYPEERGQDEQFTSSPPKLKKLKFESVGWETVPDWFQGLSLLESLEIKSCDQFREFPEWIGTLTSLKKLVIDNCPTLTSLPKQMADLSNLESLEIRECPNVVEMSRKQRNEVVGRMNSQPRQMQQREGADKGKQVLIPPFPNLKKLLLKNVGLEVIPEEFQGISSLESLEIDRCSKLMEIRKWIGSLSSSLKVLRIWRCPELTSLVNQMVGFPNLKRLALAKCPKVVEIWEKATEEEEEDWGTHNPFFPKLKYLWLGDLLLRVVPKEFRGISSLEKLSIRRWGQLEELPEWIHTLTSLNELRIYECPKLRRLPKQVADLSNLEYLKIKQCQSLTRRCEKPKGEDWPLIQHVPNVVLDDVYQR